MADARHPDATLAIGEVHTALLRSSTALSAKASEWLLSTAGGESVLRHERPMLHVVSPKKESLGQSTFLRSFRTSNNLSIAESPASGYAECAGVP